MIDVRKAEAMMLLNRSPVHFAGFQASVASLYSGGWKLEMEYDVMCHGRRAMFTNQHLYLCAFIDEFHLDQGYEVPIVVSRVMPARETFIEMVSPLPSYVRLEPGLRVDGPELYRQRIRLFDLLKFEEPVKELIVDPNEVQSLLDRIVDLQRPKQKELRQKVREEAEVTTVKTTQAKIITLSDYRKAA